MEKELSDVVRKNDRALFMEFYNKHKMGDNNPDMYKLSYDDWIFSFDNQEKSPSMFEILKEHCTISIDEFLKYIPNNREDLYEELLDHEICGYNEIINYSIDNNHIEYLVSFLKKQEFGVINFYAAKYALKTSKYDIVKILFDEFKIFPSWDIDDKNIIFFKANSGADIIIPHNNMLREIRIESTDYEKIYNDNVKSLINFISGPRDKEFIYLNTNSEITDNILSQNINFNALKLSFKTIINKEESEKIQKTINTIIENFKILVKEEEKTMKYEEENEEEENEEEENEEKEEEEENEEENEEEEEDPLEILFYYGIHTDVIKYNTIHNIEKFRSKLENANVKLHLIEMALDALEEMYKSVFDLLSDYTIKEKRAEKIQIFAELCRDIINKGLKNYETL